MADVKSVMLTMLHGDFKKLYGFVCEIGNAEVAALIDECTVFPDETCPNVLHVFWDAWTDGDEGERFVEDSSAIVPTTSPTLWTTTPLLSVRQGSRKMVLISEVVC